MSTANTTIIVKNSNTAAKIPQLEDLVMGEVAINTYDGKMFFKRDREGEQDIVEFYAKVPVENVIYVKQNGDDEDEGASWDSAYATIERALEDANTRNGQITKIQIAPGTYYTRGNLDMPDNSIIQSTYRSVVFRPEPGFEQVNVFRMGSGCFIEGPLFEGFQLDSLDNPTVGFAAVFRPGALITRTPYVHKIAVRSIPTWTQVAPPLDRENGNPYVPIGGGVVMADGAVISPYSIYPNIMTWGATPVIHNGVGYVAKNGGLVNAVNAISIWAHKHFLAIDGGQIVLSACSTQFGDYTLVSQGTREIVQPYEIDQDVLTLTEEVESANLIYSNANTIIDGMYADLVANNFTNTSITSEVSDDSLSFEDYTKRDANLFLRSLTWTLSSADEKPMLDFSKGFYDTLGNITFTRTPYDFDKCYRDTGLISDAVAYDVLFGSNYRSIVAAKSYYRANALEVVQNQKDETILALQEQKALTAAILSGDALARSDDLFDEIIDIVTNGEGNADAYVLPDPPGLTLEYETARDTLQTNRTTLQDNVITWINGQIASNTAPFDSTFTYDETACRRDVGLIIDAIVYDLTYGYNHADGFTGNIASYEAAQAYFVGSEAQYGTGEKDATIAALQQLQTEIATLLTAGPASTFAQARVGDVVAVISGSTLPRPTVDTTWPLAAYQTAFADINTNRETISNDVMIYITQETKSLLGAFIRAYEYMLNEIDNTVGVTTEAKTIARALVDNHIHTLINPRKVDEPSVITAIGHTWTAVFAGVALTKVPPADNAATITESILELDRGVVIASGQDDQGSALFVGGMEINSDTGELSGPPFQQAVNRISTRAAISRSF